MSYVQIVEVFISIFQPYNLSSDSKVESIS